MTRLDHIVVIAPDIEIGVAWVRAVLDVAPLPGGAHPRMGTHNYVVRLGRDLFLEVIAADPAARRPTGHRRWFGLDDPGQVQRDWDAGRRLRGYVACCDGLARTIGPLTAVFGEPMEITRGERRWSFGVRADGALPGDGALPSLLDWGGEDTPATAMPDVGLSLLEFVVETPQSTEVNAALDAIDMNSNLVIRPGSPAKLIAAIQTPGGVRILT